MGLSTNMGRACDYEDGNLVGFLTYDFIDPIVPIGQ